MIKGEYQADRMRENFNPLPSQETPLIEFASETQEIPKISKQRSSSFLNFFVENVEKILALFLIVYLMMLIFANFSKQNKKVLSIQEQELLLSQSETGYQIVKNRQISQQAGLSLNIREQVDPSGLLMGKKQKKQVKEQRAQDGRKDYKGIQRNSNEQSNKLDSERKVIETSPIMDSTRIRPIQNYKDKKIQDKLFIQQSESNSQQANLQDTQQNNEEEQSQVQEINVQKSGPIVETLSIDPSTRKSIINDFLSHNKEQSLESLNWALANSNQSPKSKEFPIIWKKRVSKEYGLANMKPQNDYCIVLTTLNNAKNSQIQSTIKSILSQEGIKWRVVLADGGSIDDTTKIAQKMLGKKGEIVRVKGSQSARLFWEGANRCKDNEVVVLMEGNQQLLGPLALQILETAYIGGATAAYSDEINLDVALQKINLKQGSAYDQSQSFMNLYRNVPVKYAGVRTFKGSLLKKMSENTIKDVFGDYYRKTGSDSLYTSIMELSCGSIGYINEPLTFQLSDSKKILGQQYKEEKMSIQKQLKAYC